MQKEKKKRLYLIDYYMIWHRSFVNQIFVFLSSLSEIAMQQIQPLYIFCDYFMTLQLQQMHSSAMDEFLLLTRKSKNDLRAKTRG